MAAAAVTSPDPFTFHCPVAPLSAAAPVEADVDEFEFHVVPAAAAALSAADELFSGGKLVPLHRPAPASAPCSPPPCLEVEEPASEPTSPRAPRCAGRRWRDLLLLVSSSRKPKAASGRGGGDASKCAADGYLNARRETHFRPLLSRDSSSSSSASSVDSGKNARRPPAPSSCSPLRTRSAPVANLLHLMSRTRSTGDNVSAAAAADAQVRLKRQEPAAASVLPLLTRASSSSSSSASSSDSYRNPRAGAGPWRPRGPSRPCPSRPAVAAESPRVSASGRVVFRGLERCSSTPASAGIGRRVPRPRGMERSYSANVRVDPVINVFGFGHLFMPSSPAKEKKADRERDVAAGRRNRPEKLAMVLRDPQD
ncbi:uncharacterized protein LOC8074716 [Sorghum bicolor]|uniref:uncharacterized protein LOC8074716 n=1 Tax=Sorghum bicolor TaxID=4558 RepID=UPI0001A8766D|nr:uncharacterized protein LOC8074716 [Sorghum bicolor]|eukprot:XP_002448544.1 uncharacterized protein LOC8074716 [Sorghum bicolor]